MAALATTVTAGAKARYQTQRQSVGGRASETERAGTAKQAYLERSGSHQRCEWRKTDAKGPAGEAQWMGVERCSGRW